MSSSSLRTRKHELVTSGNILAVDHGSKEVGKLSQNDPCQLLTLDTRDVSVPNAVLGYDDIPASFVGLTSSRGNAYMRLVMLVSML